VLTNKNKKKYLALSLILMGVSIVSCDFDLKEKESYLWNNDAQTQRVKTNIEEAKILSEISILNETIIFSSELALENSGSYNLKTISKQLKKDNIEIRKQLNSLAEKKLILLPNRINEKDINGLYKMQDDEGFSEAYLNKVYGLLENEIIQLKYLSSITNDVDFKVLTVKILVNLNYNLTQIHKTLK
jgi:predicted outer membrane protein